MKRLLAFLAVSLTGAMAYAANGVQAGVVVSSGSYQAISTYGNADGANRQAIVIGDFSSSDTVRVIQGKGLQVFVGTGSATLDVVSSATVVTSTYPINTNVTNTVPVSGTFFQATQPVSFDATNIATVTPGSGTFPVSGAFFQALQPVNFDTAQNVTSSYTVVTTTYPINVTGSLSASFTPPAVTTVAWANQGAQNVVSTSTVITSTYSVNTNVTNTVPVTGTFFQATQPVSFGATNIATVTPGTGTFAVSGSFSSSPPAVTTVSWQNQGAQQVVSTSTVITSVGTNLMTVTPGSGTFSSSLGATSIVTVTPGTGTVPVSSLGTNIVTVTPGSGTFAVSGSFTSSPPAITTVSWQNQGAQSVTSTYTVVTTTYSINVNQTNNPNTYTVTPGSGTVPVSSVATNLMTVTPGTGTFAVSGSFTSSPPAITTVSWQNQGAQTVTSTSTVVTSTAPLNITHNTGLPVTSSYTVVTSTSGLNVIVTSTAALNVLNVTGTNNIGTVGQSGSFIVQNTTNTLLVVSTTAFPGGGLVSSTTLLSPLAQGTTSPIAVTGLGQQMVTGLPYLVISSTWSVNVSTGTGDVVVISSPTAPNRIFLCGIMCYNTSATNSGLVLYQTQANKSGTIAHPIGLPANMVPSGIWPGCSEPFFWGASGGQISWKPDAAVTSVKCRISYYTAQ